MWQDIWPFAQAHHKNTKEEMNAQDYERWSAPLRAHPQATSCILATNKALTYLGYAIYPLLIALLALQGDPFLAQAVIVPAISFVAVSLFRKIRNKPRPYETLDIDPIIKKETKGKSFPSRHAFSITMIAMTWLAWCAPVGVTLLLASVTMAAVRVLGGVHYPSDVVTGMAIAVICGILGFWVL